MARNGLGSPSYPFLRRFEIKPVHAQYLKSYRLVSEVRHSAAVRFERKSMYLVGAGPNRRPPKSSAFNRS